MPKAETEAAPAASTIQAMPGYSRPTVDHQTLANELFRGEPLLVGEYRGHKVEEIKSVDKSTGKPAMFLKCEMAIEVGKDTVESIACEVRLPREIDSKDKVRLGLTKGQTVALRLAKLEQVKGRTLASVGSDESCVRVLV